MADWQVTGALLTPAELVELTDCKQARRQVTWLQQHGWVHEVSAEGRPKVARSYFNARMNGKPIDPHAGQRVGPDVRALDALQSTH